MRILLVYALCFFALLISCDIQTDLKRVDLDFFSFISPASLNMVASGEGVCRFAGNIGSIDLSWSFDQFSRKNMPARESGRKQPGEEIIESTKATLGDRHIWWNKTRINNIITVRMTIPLDSGYLKAEGVATEDNIEQIERSLRSLVINDENYFIDNFD